MKRWIIQTVGLGLVLAAAMIVAFSCAGPEPAANSSGVVRHRAGSLEIVNEWHFADGVTCYTYGSQGISCLVVHPEAGG